MGDLKDKAIGITRSVLEHGYFSSIANRKRDCSRKRLLPNGKKDNRRRKERRRPARIRWRIKHLPKWRIL